MFAVSSRAAIIWLSGLELRVGVRVSKLLRSNYTPIATAELRMSCRPTIATVLSKTITLFLIDTF